MKNKNNRKEVMSFIIKCPHCDQHIEILEINCQIFRCGIFKDSYQQISPHLPKEICDQLSSEEKIYGCGKPFRLIKTPLFKINEEITVLEESVWIPQICDYI